MKTIKWFNCSFPVSLEKVYTILSKQKYDDDIGIGFIFSKKREDFFCGKFIQKKEVIKSVTNPLGKTEDFSITTYETMNFTIFKRDTWLIEIEDPSRTIKPFISQIAKNMPLGFYFEEININLHELLPVIEKEFGFNRVSNVDIIDINISNKGLASLSLKSESNTLELLETYLIKNKSHKFKSFKTYFLDYEVNKSWMEVKSNCSVTIKNISTEYFLEKFRRIIFSYRLK